MTDLQLERVRRLIAEARVASTNRHSEFMSHYSDLVVEMRDFWQSWAPEGTKLPDELLQKVEAFRDKWEP